MSTPHIVKVKPNGMKVHTFGFNESELYKRLKESGIAPPYSRDLIEYSLQNCFTISISKAVKRIADDKAFWEQY